MRLNNTRILLTRTEDGNRPWASYLRARGAVVTCLPVLSTSMLPVTDAIKSQLRVLPEHDWLVLTSAAGIRYLHQAVAASDQLWPPSCPVATVGAVTAETAAAAGLQVAFRPSRPQGIVLANELQPVEGKKIFVVQSTVAPSRMAEKLRERHASVTILKLYETRLADKTVATDAVLNSDGFDAVVFASPSAVAGYINLIGGVEVVRKLTTLAVAIGPTTYAALRQAGFTHRVASADPSAKGTCAVIEETLFG